MMDFFCFLIWGFFFHFIAFGLSPLGSGYDGFFCLLIWSFFFHFIAFGLSPSGLGYDGLFLFFDLGLLFLFYWFWFKPVEFRVWRIFFVCWFGASSSFFLPLVYTRRVKAMMVFFLFFDLGLFFPFYCFRFKSVGFRLWRNFFVFWFGASFSILLPLV